MKRKILSLLVLSFIIIKAYPQNSVSRAIRGERGISNQFTSLEDEQAIKFNPAQAKSLFDLNNNADLVLQKTEQDKLGFIHYRFYQTYKSIPIENSMYIVHTKNGVLQSLSGAIVTDFDPAINQRAAQKIASTDAVSIAIKHVNAKVYAWQEAGMEKSLKEQTKKLSASYKPTASLVWYSSTEDINPRDLRLCYKVDVYATQPLSRAYYFIDALTGKVIGKKDRIFNSDATGTASTAYSGSQTIHSDFTGSSYRLRDYTKGSGVITLHGESGSVGVDYTSASSNWSLAGTNIAALDAHYGISQTYAFYYNNFGRNSYDGAGTALYSYVNDPTYIDNAFWNGSAMYFNKRSNGAPGGVTGIDVCGHELTHGVTQESSGLNYSYQSGAMNESMSDIMGKSVQFYSKPADIDWKLSNDMSWIIRDMSNPNAEGQPDTYLGTYWYTGSGDNGGVHYNSGVGNFMFYLLVTGGSGTNDNGDSYAVTGIGLYAADQILYRTNTTYLTPTSQYANWRTACINAATDLYGAGSNAVLQVQNAWHAVGIGAAAPCAKVTGLKAIPISTTSETVAWTAVPGAVKYSLRYKKSSESTWTFIQNIYSTSYNLTGLTANTSYKYKVQAVCAGNVKGAFSAVASFKSNAPGDYCGILGSTGFEYIQKVKFGAISNTSGNDGGYGDYTNLTANLAAGSSVQLKLTPGFPSSSYDEYWKVYIDYNHDGDFDDAGENIASGHKNAVLTRSVTIPLTAHNGTTRMRVIMHYSSYLAGKCGIYYDGEAEDYTVKITGGTGIASENSSAEQNTLNSMIVSPNPVKTSSANLVLQIAKAAPVKITISDLSGRILRSEKISSITAGKNNYSLRNLNLLPGTYMIIAEQSNGIVARTQFIVDK